MSYRIKGTPWTYKGSVNVSDCKTSQEVMEKAALDWNVAKCPLFAEMPIVTDDRIDESLDRLSEQLKRNEGHTHGNNIYKLCESNFGIYRTDCNYPLGIVKGKYTPVQNVDAFKFFDDAIGENEAIFQTAGFFGAGERIFVSAKLPDTIKVHGDSVDSYLVFTNSHDGSTGVKILFTPIRVVCENTLNMAIKTTANYVNFRHTQSVNSKIDMAGEILGITKTMSKETELKFNELYAKKMTDIEVMEYLVKNVLSETELETMKTTGHKANELVFRSGLAVTDIGLSTRKLNVLCDMFDYYQNGIGQKEIAGTGWGAYNAVSGYYSNVDNIEGIKRMDSLLYGDKGNKISKSAAILMEA